LKTPLDCRYNVSMTTKEIALKTISELPEDASWEDIQERINFVAAVRKGFRELDEGKGIPHDKVKEEFAEWLTN
jgi:predicted transcriptional regulator